ncbi:MAG TPA: helix-turn-helix transcriptional regulator [Ilumatobacter sp.]|nr:helix-turn-helix transcriptional regulator [Ilumatobacter sp.]
MRPITTGFPTVDAALGGLITGDNVVWVCDDPGLYRHLADGFVSAATAGVRGARCLYVDLGAGLLPAGGAIERLDAGPATDLRAAGVLADELERRVHADPPAALVIDPLARAGRRWSPEATERFFERICPAMLQAGVTAYWCIDTSLGRSFVDQVRPITQCLLDVRGGRLRVLKAEGRPEALLGISYQLSDDDGAVVATSAPAGGRLARGLAALRAQLGLTQQELAAAAGVTPSAISQAESGARGLSLDTVVVIADRFEIPVDRLLGGSGQRTYRLARHDRARRLPDPHVTALSADSTVGMRAYLVEPPDSQWREPPVEHRGVATLAGVRGLIQVDLGDDRPVLRAGDVLVVDGAPVRAWRRLRNEPAACFYILRD